MSDIDDDDTGNPEHVNGHSNGHQTFNGIGPDEGSTRSLIHVPDSASEFLPPRGTTLITEVEGLYRVHWDEVKGFFLAMAGLAPSIHGSFALDEAALIFKVQKIAEDNGYVMLGDVTAARVRRAHRWAYKRLTQIPVYQLQKQRIMLQLEQRRSLAG